MKYGLNLSIFFDDLNNEFDFTLDPCALPENAKCDKYYTPHYDGLTKDWQGEKVFCNLPYVSKLKSWVKNVTTRLKNQIQRWLC